MHFTISKGLNSPKGELRIKIDRGSKEARDELIHGKVGFDKDGSLRVNNENLFLAMYYIASYVENYIDGECSFEVE